MSSSVDKFLDTRHAVTISLGVGTYELLQPLYLHTYLTIFLLGLGSVGT